ncbi:tRNA (guanosine(18)-2'-O)-methyltransferase [Candidatus Dependentiae bacterium Noda2021]|nr:tRNA (guanosine(18)-2'-O)-methyltransferase [Candidatus Dependentiae bacterium Noda2021]
MEDLQKKQQLVNYLLTLVSPNKRQKITSLIQERTRHITVVLEDIFQPHNASAIVRTVECQGLQDAYLVEHRNKFKPTSGIAKGSSYWLDMHRFKKIDECVADLKAKGYAIVATTPHATSTPINQISLDRKLALVFGTENMGLSQYVLNNADEFVTIPMYGFTQSYNVSVSVALCLYELNARLRQSTIPWQLSQQEMLDIQLAWLRRIISGVHVIEQEWHAQSRQ